MITRKLFTFFVFVFIFIGLCFGQAGKDYVSPYIGKLKYVPAGSFTIQDIYEATTDTFAYTKYIGTSTVSAFRMSEHEITRAQYVAVTGLKDPSDTRCSTGMNDPVQNVRWYHALVFCNKLSTLEGLTPVYSIKGSIDPAAWGAVPSEDSESWNAVIADWSANGYRLPTEMEWMWAAMGADTDNPGIVNTTGYNKDFSGSNGSNNIGEYGWFFENSNSTTHPVGTKHANELGLYDMSGNVWEWCWDWYIVYPTGSTTNYRETASSGHRVSRGGSWFSNTSGASIAIRNYYSPYRGRNGLGLRVVRSN